MEILDFVAFDNTIKVWLIAVGATLAISLGLWWVTAIVRKRVAAAAQTLDHKSR